MITRKLALFTTIFVVTLGFFGCEDKDDSVFSALKKSDSTSDYIARYDAKEQQIYLNFDADEFRSKLEEQIKDSLGVTVVEKVQVEDDKPTDKDYYGYLVFSYYVVDKDETYTSAIQLDKDLDDSGDVIYYSAGKTTVTVTCKANSNCKQGECSFIKGSKNKSPDCSSCSAGCDKISTGTTVSDDNSEFIRQVVILALEITLAIITKRI